LEHAYEAKWWATYRQWQALGRQVQRGQRGTQIVFWRPVVRTVTVNDDGEEKTDSFPILRTWTVFNVAQVEGGEVERFRATKEAPVSTNFVDYSPAEEVIAATKADIRHGGDRAFYSPESDFIQLPPKPSFLAEHEFYHTAFHE